jgi:hypothetical protein
MSAARVGKTDSQHTLRNNQTNSQRGQRVGTRSGSRGLARAATPPKGRDPAAATLLEGRPPLDRGAVFLCPGAQAVCPRARTSACSRGATNDGEVTGT